MKTEKSKHMSLKTQLKEKVSEKRAVSPVIGVILMVAITVILAAIIGTFVLGLGENVQQNASAGVAQVSGNNDAVTLNSLGPSTAGIKCAGFEASAGVDVYSGSATGDYTTEIGTELDCSGSAIVAYGKDVSNSTVFTFDN